MGGDREGEQHPGGVAPGASSLGERDAEGVSGARHAGIEGRKHRTGALGDGDGDGDVDGVLGAEGQVEALQESFRHRDVVWAGRHPCRRVIASVIECVERRRSGLHPGSASSCPAGDDGGELSLGEVADQGLRRRAADHRLGPACFRIQAPASGSQGCRNTSNGMPQRGYQ